jgi:hypothetical protein
MRISIYTTNDGWDALYFDGELVFEGDVTPATLMGALMERKIFLEEVEYDNPSLTPVQNAAIEDEGCFPDKERDI